MAARAEIIREKGTNRSQFFRGQVDKYTWVDIGSSYLPGEIIAAFLWAQMEDADNITSQRMEIWRTYHDAFDYLEKAGRLCRPTIPENCMHNAHMYYLIMHDLADRAQFINVMKKNQVNCVFHYVPLHSSPKGSITGRTHDALPITENLSERLVRLPLWVGLQPEMPILLKEIINQLEKNDASDE